MKRVRAVVNTGRVIAVAALIVGAIGVTLVVAGCGSAASRSTGAPGGHATGGANTSTPSGSGDPRHASSTPPQGGSTNASGQPTPYGMPGHWKMIFNSSFGSKLDNRVWRTGWFGTGITGPVNPIEVACYSSSNVTLPGDGSVNLRLTHSSHRCGGKTEPYTGAMLSTDPRDGRSSGGFQYRYGYLEARIYVPRIGAALANWATVLTLGQDWPRDGEDDIFETANGRPCFVWHSPGYTGGFDGCDKSISPGWHTVASDWEPGSVKWYYDGKLVGDQTAGVTSAPNYIAIIDTANGTQAGYIRPATMKVAYVRVWQKAGRASD